MKILHIDMNHPLMIQQFSDLGFENHEDYNSSKTEIEEKVHLYDGIIIRSRFKIDQSFLDKAINLKFIGRVGAGLENIDCNYAKKKGIELIAAPEGNRNAVGEHALGMLLCLFNKLNTADTEVKQGKWLRENNRGLELDGKTIGLIGYGNTGKAFAKKLSGFDTSVIFHDLVNGLGDEYASQVSLKELQAKADVLSLHIPQTELTIGMVNSVFIHQFKKSFWLINTARGKSVVIKDLVSALHSGKVLGAGLDVLEYESSSFEDLFSSEPPKDFVYLIKAKIVLLPPLVAGWSVDSKVKLAEIIVDKVRTIFCGI